MSSPSLAPKSKKLNSLQLSLLRLFGQNINENQTLEIRKIMMDYFDGQLKSEIENVVKEKGYYESDFQKMLSEKSWCGELLSILTVCELLFLLKVPTTNFIKNSNDYLTPMEFEKQYHQKAYLASTPQYRPIQCEGMGSTILRFE